MSLGRVEQIRTWADLVHLYNEELSAHPGWLFRGQGRASWALTSSLERAILRTATNLDQAERIEERLYRRFIRQAHHHVSNLPTDWLEGLALMQHHGAPTRLSDWTYSFWVATFFAVEELDPTKTDEKDRTCAIWALDMYWWRRRAVEELDDVARDLLADDPAAKEPATVTAILKGKGRQKLIFPVNPERMNARLVIQQGGFLAPADITSSFEDNLKALSHGGSSASAIKIEFTLDVDEFRKALRELNAMNVTRATLFPGLDGFSANLKNLMFVPKALALPGESGRLI